MKKLMVVVGIIVGLLVSGFLVHKLIKPVSYPFSSPQNLAQKIANFVVAHDKKPIPTSFGNRDGSSGEGFTYQYKVYRRTQIFNINIGIQNSGRKSLHITFYCANVDLDRLKKPADVVAQELMYGRFEIYEEIHVSDFQIAGKADLCQIYRKKRQGGAFWGFTREERDKKKFGVEEFLFDEGEILEKGKWRKADKETEKEIQEEYNYYLVAIAQVLKIE